MLAGAGLHALNLIKENPHFVSELQDNCRYMHKGLRTLEGFHLNGHELSPLKFLSLLQSTDTRQGDHKVLDAVILHVSQDI